MKRNNLTRLIAAAVALSLCGAAALAAGTKAEAAPVQRVEAQAVRMGAEAPEEESPEEELTPDPEGTVTFANLESRVRAGSLNYLILQENIENIEATDYNKLEESMRKSLNTLADAQWGMSNIGTAVGNPFYEGVLNLSGSMASSSLSAQYESLRTQYDNLKEGKLQENAADAVLQLKNTQDSIVMMTESLFVQLKELDAADATLGRSLDALDRQLQELELRYQKGQISALTLRQAQAGRTSLVSKRESLASSAGTARMNLAALLGEDLTAQLKLGDVPQVTDEQLSKMNLEKDLAAAKEHSYTLYDAKKTLDDARKAYIDAGGDLGNEKRYQYIQARHTWHAAQFTYEAAVQSYELSFRNLYSQIQDYRQVLGAARTALALEQDNYAVDRLKFEQGTISQNDLLTAGDDLAAAQDTVDAAERNLFSAWNNYCWAVETGILN